MDNEKSNDQIIRRLDVLISLQLEFTLDRERVPISTKIKKLAELGLSASEISNILDKPLNYITANLSKKRVNKNK